MNKAELINIIANELDMSKTETASVLNTILETMANKLGQGESIELRGFGSFAVKQRGSYEGRNPKTGEKFQVKQKRMPHFKVGKNLREAVNGGRNK